MKKPILILLIIAFANFVHAQQPADTSNKVVTFVEINATFAGPGTFFDFIAANMGYPTNAVKNHVQGKVLVQFTVELDGHVEAKILRSVSAELDSEALRVVRLSKWHPAVQNGRKVTSLFTVPFTFSLPVTATNTDTAATHSQATDDPLNQPVQTQTLHPLAAFDTAQIFAAVEFPPTFPGGDEELNKYIAASLKTLHNTDNGKVILNFVVERDGSLSDFKVLRSVNETAAAMAITIMKNCPKWNAGVQNGHKVRCYYTIPMKFQSTE